MEKQVLLTEEGLKKLEDELEQLKTEKRKEIAEKIKVALSFGDLSENSEYDEAKNEQALVEARIATIEATLKNVQVISEKDIDTNKVFVGTKVKLLDVESKEECTYKIVGSNEADPDDGKISDMSPVGNGLIGHKIGQKVKISTPGGTAIYKILEISK
ncbi:MAG: transcription elongation factor GreA [Clostridia bacterium]|nr:transcription elongation factor GreA [Clostridia bacterium]